MSRSYDDWKTTNPEDQFLGPDPDEQEGEEEPQDDEPFGRQPRPVTVTIEGEPEDVYFWTRRIHSACEYKGDMVQPGPSLPNSATLRVYPRAVND